MPGGEVAPTRSDACSTAVLVEQIVAAVWIGIRGLRSGELRLRHAGLCFPGLPPRETSDRDFPTDLDDRVVEAFNAKYFEATASSGAVPVFAGLVRRNRTDLRPL